MCKRIFIRKQLEALKILTLVGSGWVIYEFSTLTFPVMSTYPLKTSDCLRIRVSKLNLKA